MRSKKWWVYAAIAPVFVVAVIVGTQLKVMLDYLVFIMFAVAAGHPRDPDTLLGALLTALT